MPIFFADTWFLSDRFISLDKGIIFPGDASSETDLVVSFELVKCITKININSYLNYIGKVEGRLSPER